MLIFDAEWEKEVNLSFPSSVTLRKVEPLWQLQGQGERYTSIIKLFDEADRQCLEIDCEGSGVFDCRGDVINIAWQNEGTGFEHYLQTVGLSLWLEMRGVLCIHANALLSRMGVVGLIAPSRTGKTTLTAALAERSWAMMTDDMMAVHKAELGWRVYPGWPQLRMWPEVAQHFVENSSNLQRVHSRFEKRIVKLDEQRGFNYSHKSGLLKRLYLLDRKDDAQTKIRIESVAAAESMLSLLKNSMLADAYRPLGIESSRLAALAELLNNVQVRKVIYPSGKEYLSKVCQCIEADLEE